MEMRSKVCPYCGEEKPEAAFKPKSKKCRKCMEKTWIENKMKQGFTLEDLKKQRSDAWTRWAPRRSRVYEKATPSKSHYDAQFLEQNGVCAICKQEETHTRNGSTVALAQDHDHKTGELRGLLCHRHNVGIGFFQENPLLLAAAAEYLAKWKVTPDLPQQ